MKLRKTQPYMERPFKTPLYPLIPVLGVIFSLSMLVAPVLFGDGNALDALTSGLGLVALVLGSYYLRMTGRFRVQIALGGVGIGTGIILLCLNLISLLGFAQPIIYFIPSYVQLFFSIILIVSGYFNFIAHSYKSRKNESGQMVVAKPE
jgi:hypothetical protein